MKTRILFILAFFPFLLNAQQNISEAVSPAKPIHLIGSIDNVNGFVKMYVENGITAWQQKGEFEKITDYKIRVIPETRKQKADDLANEAFEVFKKAFVTQLKSNDFILGDYDADNETFLIKSIKLGDFAIKVPIAEAPSFKENFYSCNFFAYDFYASNNIMHLAKVQMENPENNKTYSYDSKVGATYIAENMVYGFEPIEVGFEQDALSGNSSDNIIYKTTNIGNDPVDLQIPVSQTILENTFVLAIGNENYTQEQNVPFAVNDARIFAKYMELTLGIPKNRITLLENATLGTMIGAVEGMKTKARIYDGEATLIMYYAGHGMPDNATKDAYLLPVDGSSNSLRAAFSLNKLYSELTQYPSEKTVVFLDACFSGDSRNGMLASGRGLSIEPNREVVQGKLIVFSATSGKQTAHPYTEKGHGLFTYYLLLKLQKTAGSVNFGDLFDYLNKQVSRTSLDIKKEQTPDINTSPEISGMWQNMKFK